MKNGVSCAAHQVWTARSSSTVCSSTNASAGPPIAHVQWRASGSSGFTRPDSDGTSRSSRRDQRARALAREVLPAFTTSPAPERQQQIVRLQLGAKRCRRPSSQPQRTSFFLSMPRAIFADGDALDRFLPRGVDRHQDDPIARLQRGGEFRREEFRAGIAVRLEENDEAAVRPAPVRTPDSVARISVGWWP